MGWYKKYKKHLIGILEEMRTKQRNIGNYSGLETFKINDRHKPTDSSISEETNQNRHIWY